VACYHALSVLICKFSRIYVAPLWRCFAKDGLGVFLTFAARHLSHDRPIQNVDFHKDISANEILVVRLLYSGGEGELCYGIH
jgi:hypothetical protein